MSWYTNVIAAQQAKQAAQQQQATQPPSYTVTNPDGSQVVKQGPAPSPVPVDPQSPNYNAQVASDAKGNQTLYVRQGYQATVVKQYSTPAGQTVKEYSITPLPASTPAPTLTNDVFTGKNLNFAGQKPVISTNEQRVAAIATIVTAGTPAAAASLGLGRASTLIAQGVVGAGLNAGIEYKETGKVTPTNVITGAAEGVAFGVIGGKVNSILKITGAGLPSVFGRVAVNTSLGAAFAAGGEYVTTGRVTPETVAIGAGYGTAFGATGELIGYGASKINSRYNVADSFRSTNLGGRLTNAVANFDESVGGVPASRFTGGREMLAQSSEGGEVKIARITQLDTEPVRISKSQADLYRGSSAKEISLAGTEQRSVLSGGEAPEPDYVKTVYDKGVAKNYTVDTAKVVQVESEQAVANTLTNLGESKAADAYLAQYRASGQFESTRMADPYLAAVNGKDFVASKERIGDLRAMMDTRVEGAPKSVSDVAFNVDAYEQVKLATGTGRVGTVENLGKDSGVVMLSKKVQAIGDVPEGQIISNREITGIKLTGKMDEDVNSGNIKVFQDKDLRSEMYDTAIKQFRVQNAKDLASYEDLGGVLSKEKFKPVSYPEGASSNISKDYYRLLKGEVEGPGPLQGEPSASDNFEVSAEFAARSKAPESKLVNGYPEGTKSDIASGQLVLPKENSLVRQVRLKLGEFVSDTRTRNTPSNYRNAYTDKDFTGNKIAENFVASQKSISKGINPKEYSKITEANVGGEKPFGGYINEKTNIYEGYSKGGYNEGLAAIAKERQAPVSKRVTLPDNILSVAPKSTGLSAQPIVSSVAATGAKSSTKNRNTSQNTGSPVASGPIESLNAKPVANPFTAFRGRPYYDQHQSGEATETEIYQSYPDSGLPSPGQLKSQILPVVLGSDVNIKSGIGVVPSLLPKYLNKQTQVTTPDFKVGLGSDVTDITITDVTPITTPINTQVNTPVNLTSTQPTITGDITATIVTSKADTKLNMPSFKFEGGGLSLPPARKRPGVRSRKEVTPILTGAEVLKL